MMPSGPAHVTHSTSEFPKTSPKAFPLSFLSIPCQKFPQLYVRFDFTPHSKYKCLDVAFIDTTQDFKKAIFSPVFSP